MPALLLAVAFLQGPSDIDLDEQVVLFPVAASRSDDDRWTANVRGWIFEPSDRRADIALLHRLLGDGDEHLGPHFAERMARFLVDNERGETVRVRIGEEVFALEPSEPSGHFAGRVAFGHAGGPQVTPLTVEALTAEDDPRRFAGELFLVPPRGLSIVCDIDDTLRIAHVSDRSEAVRRALGEPYEAVPGMAGLLARWTAGGAVAVHYVSGSPWQLYEPLRAFFAREQLPPGSFHLRPFRLLDMTAGEMMSAPVKQKSAAITELLEQFPQRRFVLIGDDGERDPELYGELARAHPGQVRLILIRQLSPGAAEDEDEDDDDDEERGAGPGSAAAERWRIAFRDLPADGWRVFRSAEELAGFALPVD